MSPFALRRATKASRIAQFRPEPGKHPRFGHIDSPYAEAQSGGDLLRGLAMVHLAGWPLGQLWLLVSSLLFLLLLPLGLLLAGRLRAWAALGEAPAPARLLGFSLTYAGLILLVLLAISALMGAKPA